MSGEDKRGTGVLIVDDEPDLCEMLSFEFAARGYQVTSALDGRRALDVLHNEPVGVVVTDLRMPHLNGLELLDWLKNLDVNDPIMVLMSAYADVTIGEAHHRGAEAFFSKPFRLADMVKMVHKLCLPPRRRWAQPPPEMPIHYLNLRLPSLEAGAAQGVFDVGRGGACLAVERLLLFAGQRVGFDVILEDGPFARLSGAGVVRWAEARESTEGPPVCGIEFEYLNDETREPFGAWLETQRRKAYIPDPRQP